MAHPPLTPSSYFGRKVAILPAEGVLLVATDLQGNLVDYRALQAIYEREERAGNQPILAFCGDLVHGPNRELNLPDAWPDYLGTPYRDESAELILDYLQFTTRARTFSILGNHEHAHIGGPPVSKFHSDEAAVLDVALGPERERVHDFLRGFPLLAVAPCGVVLTHGAPAATEPHLAAFEDLRYDGYQRYSLLDMILTGTVGALLWARSASAQQARALLRATSLDGQPGAFVAYGHDVVHEGYDMVGDEQICLSTSYGLEDARKVYLRLDLSHRYRSVRELRPGIEILPLYPPGGRAGRSTRQSAAAQ